MNPSSQKLYDEFLARYHLDNGLYNHAVELSKPYFTKLEGKAKVLQFETMMVPVTPAVANAVKLRNQIHLSQIQAERDLKSAVKRFRTYRLEQDDAELLASTVEENVLRPLLWPFHLLTVGSELDEAQFGPIAHRMEGLVCDVFRIVDTFYNSFISSQNEISRRRDAQLARMDQQTAAQAANAPLEVRGSLRELGGRLHIYANVRSTVTGGMIAADYQVNELLANQNARNESLQQQKGLLDYLETSLLKITDQYIPLWKAYIQDPSNFPGVLVGKHIFAKTVYSTAVNMNPHTEENAKKLFNVLKNDDFAKLEYYLRYYGFDFDALFGKKVAIHIFNSYVRENKVDETNPYYRFYAYFYDLEHPIQRKELFDCFKHELKVYARGWMEKVYAKNKEKYVSDTCDRVLRKYYDLLDSIPGLDNMHRRYLSNALHYIYYDVMGNISTRDIYDEKNDDFVFIYDED